MKTLLAVVSIAVAVHAALAGHPDTTLVSGEAWGTWTEAGSPYAVVGALVVPAGSTLVIEPGVEVRFRGRYQFVVNGCLKALGTDGDSVVFTRDQSIQEHEWSGLRFVGSAPGCTLAYCRVEYVRNDGPYPEVRGGAVYCEQASPVIRHCALCHNYSHNGNANGGGGGVFVLEAAPVVEDCHIFDNYVDSGGGICTLENGTTIIRNCVIEDNTATYSGGGMYLGVRSGPTATGNIIRNNRCSGGWGGGGITLWNWYAIGPVSKTVTNNLIAGNSASDAGGGMYTRYDLSFIYNNTFVNNSAGRGGGVYVLNEGAYLPDVRNCIIWDNTASQGPAVYLDPGNSSAIDLTWSDVEGGWAGTGNFDSVPAFADTAWFRLGDGSRCIDAGTSDGTPGEDFEGQARVDLPGYPNRGGGSMPWYDVGWDEMAETGVQEQWSRKPESLVHPTLGRRFGLPADALVFDATGRLVWRSGRDGDDWDGYRLDGTAAGAGVYVVRLGRSSQRVVLLGDD